MTLKKQLINYNLFIIIILIFFILSKPTLADIIKPNVNIDPKKVVKIQLLALMKNDLPNKDSGIIQTWIFAHPKNQKVTGPIERFKNMVKTELYSMLLNHTSHEILEVYKSNKIAIFEVTVLDKEKKYYKFKWQVEKYISGGNLNNCWLTTAVSQPISLGSSI